MRVGPTVLIGRDNVRLAVLVVFPKVNALKADPKFQSSSNVSAPDTPDRS